MDTMNVDEIWPNHEVFFPFILIHLHLQEDAIMAFDLGYDEEDMADITKGSYKYLI